MSERSRRLRKWARVLFISSLGGVGLWIFSPLLFGLLGWPWPGYLNLPIDWLVFMAIGLSARLRYRADPLFDRWPWDRNAPRDGDTLLEDVPPTAIDASALVAEEQRDDPR